MSSFVKNIRKHFVTKNSILERQDNNLILHILDENGNKISRTPLPSETIEEIYFLSKTHIDTETIAFCSDKNILLHFFNHQDRYTGTFFPSGINSVNKSGFVLIEQVRAFLDTGKRLYIAKQINKAHFESIVYILKKYEIDSSYAEGFLEHIKACKTIEELMLLEGRLKEWYYQQWNLIVKDKRNFYFEYRSKRPPLDKINVLISFMNTLIYSCVLSQIYKTELEPRISFLHEPNYRRLSLHLDLAEFIKPRYGDNLIFTLINKKIITTKSFKKENGFLLLNQDAKVEIIKQTSAMLGKNYSYKQRELPLKELIKIECNNLKRFIVEGGEYEPFIHKQ
jgi:CRISPR-associated protein Cas1